MFKPADEIRKDVERANEDRMKKCYIDWINKISLVIQNLGAQALETGSAQGVSSYINLDGMPEEAKNVIFSELAKAGYRVVWNSFVGEYEISIP